MFESQRWAIEFKTDHKVIMDNDTIYRLGTNDEYCKLYPRYRKLAENLEDEGFSLEVTGCACKEIDGKSFFDYGLLGKESLNDDEESKITRCAQAAKEGNVVALFDYGLYIISKTGEPDDDSYFDSLEFGLCLLKDAAQLGNCRAMCAFADRMLYNTLIDTGVSEDWIEKYLSINPCKKDELSLFIISDAEIMKQVEKNNVENEL